MNGVNQRHNLVLLFSDLSDSTRIAAGMEPEDYAELLNRLRGLVSTIITRHGGEVVRIDGDGALCIFGYPLAHEDAGRRAVEAAIDLHAGVAALEPGFVPDATAIRLHSGIHAGIVLLRGGDLVRGRYEMLGDATNVAARLCDAAGAGGILVSTGTLGEDRHFFQTGDVRQVRVSGHAETIPVLPVLGRAELQSRFAARTRRSRTPFTGRARERAVFAEWLEGDAEAEAQPVLTISGAPGIGKSRLVAQLAEDAAARGWRTLRGHCEAYQATPPLQPFVQMAADGEGGQMVGPRADADSQAGPDAGAVRAEDLREALVRAALDEPVLLVVDDWQWADDASRDLLAELAGEAAAGLPLRILLAARPGEEGIEGGALLALAPLEPGEVDAAIRALLAASTEFDRERIGAASGGSPLLIEELCRAYGSGGALPEQDPRGEWFDLAVQSRFAALDADDADFLRLVAIMGTSAPLALLAQVLGRALDPARLDRLEEADFLSPAGDGEVAFRHGLTRDAVHAAIGLAERRKLHARVLAVIEDQAARLGEGGLIDALARHAIAAGVDDRAEDYALRAGDAALDAGALDRARLHYRSALDLARRRPGGEERAARIRAIMNKFGLASIIDPAPAHMEVISAARAVLEQDGSARDRMRAAYWLGAIDYGLGMGRSSVRHLQAARELAEATDRPHDLSLVSTKLAQSLFASGAYAPARALFEAELPALRAPHGRNGRDTSAYAFSCYAFLHADQGDFARAAELFAEADDILGDADKPMIVSCVTYQAAAALWQGEWDRALALAQYGLDHCRQRRTRQQYLMNRAMTAYARWQTHRDPAAIAELDEAAALFLAPGNSRQRASLMIGWLIEVQAEAGERDRARALAGPLVDCIRRGGDRLGEAMGWRALARLEAAHGNNALAMRCLSRAERSATLRGSRREAAQNLRCRAELVLMPAKAEADELSARAEAEFAAMGLAAFSPPAVPPSSR